ncbi:proteoglycan 4-like [Helicoverpa zea]|uniref:proteoglycan 4-like n=1 Tax=Helicoverpa zea TaxID=7113 RepID=UPI001F56A87E|nr:proteoglycan 4-like [Helicoverpa zea]
MYLVNYFLIFILVHNIQSGQCAAVKRSTPGGSVIEDTIHYCKCTIYSDGTDKPTECLVDESKIEPFYTEEMVHNMKEFCKALTPTILKPIVEAHKHKPKIEPEPTSEPKVPPTNEPGVPPTNEPKVPPTNKPKVPPTSELNVPATSELNVPPTNEPKVPATNEPKVPPTNEPKVPATNEPKVTPKSELNLPPTNEPKVPATNEPKVPPTNEPKVPPTNEPKVPPTNEPKVPPTNERKVPPSSSSDVIPTQPQSSTDVTPELSYVLCKKAKRHCYSGETLESVVKLVVSICACSNKQISTDNPVECTIDNGLHGLSSTMTTAMDRLCENIGEIYDKFEEMGDLEEGFDDNNKPDKKVPVSDDLHKLFKELPNTEEYETNGMTRNRRTNVLPDKLNIENQTNVQPVEQKEKEKTNDQLENKTGENAMVKELTKTIDNLSNSSPQGTTTNEEQNLINAFTENVNRVNPPNKTKNSKRYPGNENAVLNNSQNIPNGKTLDKFKKKQQHLSNEDSGNKSKQLKQQTSHSTNNHSNKNFDNNSVSPPKNRNKLPNDAENVPSGNIGNREDKSGNKKINKTEISLQNGSNNSPQNNFNGENLTTNMATTKSGATTEGPFKRKKQPKNKTVNIDSRQADDPDPDVKEKPAQQYSLETVIVLTVCGFAYGTLLTIIIRMTYTRCRRRGHNFNHSRA